MGGHAPKTTVLIHEWVTGGGLAGSELPASWATEGRAMRLAIARDFAAVSGVEVVMTLDARLPPEHGPWRVVPIGPGAEPSRFATLAAEADFTALIAPESGGILAAGAATLESLGARSLGSTREAIETAGDKLRLSRRLDEHGIANPAGRRVVPRNGLPPDAPYPAVLKPIDGAGSLETFLVPHPGMVPEEAKHLPEALLQTFVPGVVMSASFLVGDRGTRILGIGRQRMDLSGGRFVYLGGTLPAPRNGEEATLRRAIAAVPGLRGFVGIDFVKDSATGNVTILEINPRATTSYVGLARLLPRGTLAGAWLETLEGDCIAQADDLAAIVHASDELTFDADGTIRRDGKEAPS